jgi:acetyl esterase/lipase
MRLRWPSCFGVVVGLLMTVTSTAWGQGATSTAPAETHTVLRLWQGDAPGAQGTSDADVPTLTVFLPDPHKANGAAIVVCPGGGYHALAAHEGKPVAEWLNTLGVTAFVLKYRLGPKYHHPVEMGDVQRAIRTVRARADEWKLDARRIGVLGFSAGGHLASTAVTHFDDGKPDAEDPIERAGCRPDFGVLIYPVITMTGPFTHRGSRTNLLGDSPPDELIELMSSEKQVTDRTPPCFLVHTATDKVVPFQNSLMFAEAMQKHHVPVELHVFDHGAHGFGLGGKDPVLSEWPALCAKWMASHGWL